MARSGMRSGGPGSVKVPFPVVPKSLGGMSRETFVEKTDQAPLVDVPMHALHATQPSVDPEEVARMRASPPHVMEGTRSPKGLLVDHPVVVKLGGKLQIWDGTHRATAAKERGDNRILARLVDIDAHTSAKSGGLAMWAAKRSAA